MNQGKANHDTLTTAPLHPFNMRLYITVPLSLYSVQNVVNQPTGFKF